MMHGGDPCLIRESDSVYSGGSEIIPGEGLGMVAVVEPLDEEGEDALDRQLVNVFNVVRVTVLQRLPDRVQEGTLDRLTSR